MRAYRIAGFLRYGAVQFLVLTPAAMIAYAGGTWWNPDEPHYQVTGNFLSDLGMTHSFSGRANTASAVMFAVALATIGAGLIAFAWTWRAFAFARGRAAWAGRASAVFGSLSGACFVGVACTPFDLALNAHNDFVIAAFALLACYVAAATAVMVRNGLSGIRLAANLAYLALVLGYVALVLLGPRLDTPAGHRTQVIGQKIIAYGSMLHVLYLATTVRRQLQSVRRQLQSVRRQL